MPIETGSPSGSRREVRSRRVASGDTTSPKEEPIMSKQARYPSIEVSGASLNTIAEALRRGDDGGLEAQGDA
jgi:hypothetical protein